MGLAWRILVWCGVGVAVAMTMGLAGWAFVVSTRMDGGDTWTEGCVAEAPAHVETRVAVGMRAPAAPAREVMVRKDVPVLVRAAPAKAVVAEAAVPGARKDGQGAKVVGDLVGEKWVLYRNDGVVVRLNSGTLGEAEWADLAKWYPWLRLAQVKTQRGQVSVVAAAFPEVPGLRKDGLGRLVVGDHTKEGWVLYQADGVVLPPRDVAQTKLSPAAWQMKQMYPGYEFRVETVAGEAEVLALTAAQVAEAKQRDEAVAAAEQRAAEAEKKREMERVAAARAQAAQAAALQAELRRQQADERLAQEAEARRAREIGAQEQRAAMAAAEDERRKEAQAEREQVERQAEEEAKVQAEQDRVVAETLRRQEAEDARQEQAKRQMEEMDRERVERLARAMEDMERTRANLDRQTAEEDAAWRKQYNITR